MLSVAGYTLNLVQLCSSSSNYLIDRGNDLETGADGSLPEQICMLCEGIVLSC